MKQTSTTRRQTQNIMSISQIHKLLQRHLIDFAFACIQNSSYVVFCCLLDNRFQPCAIPFITWQMQCLQCREDLMYRPIVHIKVHILIVVKCQCFQLIEYFQALQIIRIGQVIIGYVQIIQFRFGRLIIVERSIAGVKRLKRKTTVTQP